MIILGTNEKIAINFSRNELIYNIVIYSDKLLQIPL